MENNTCENCEGLQEKLDEANDNIGKLENLLEKAKDAFNEIYDAANKALDEI